MFNYKIFQKVILTFWVSVSLLFFGVNSLSLVNAKNLMPDFLSAGQLVPLEKYKESIDECIKKFKLKDYLVKNGGDIIGKGYNAKVFRYNYKGNMFVIKFILSEF